MITEKDREKIEAIRARFTATLASIRADRGLSELGKAERIEVAYAGAREQVDAIRTKSREAEQARRVQLERALFGVGGAGGAAAVISARDAADRVDALRKPEELAAVMQRAASTGDDALERAGLRVAVQRSTGGRLDGEGRYAALVREYAAQHPDRADAVSEYVALSAAAAPSASFTESVAVALPRPAELGRRRPAAADS